MALYKYFCAMEGLGVLPRPRLTKPSRPRRGPWPDRPQGRLDRLCAIIRVHWNGRMQFRCSVIPLAPRARRKGARPRAAAPAAGASPQPAKASLLAPPAPPVPLQVAFFITYLWALALYSYSLSLHARK
jgi:hypothetical protein